MAKLHALQNSRERMWKIEAKKDNKTTADVTLYGPISNEVWWGDEITPNDFKKALDAIDASVDTLNIYINSPGGDVFAGQTICSMLERHPAKKITHADGLAASIASIIFCMGEERHMPSNSMIMIHCAWSCCFGNSKDMRKLADDLEKVDGLLANTYVSKSNQTREEIIALMDEETWMDSAEAFEKGFATHTDEEKKMAAAVDGQYLILNGQYFDKTKFKHMPDVQIEQDVKETGPVNGYQNYEKEGEPHITFVQGKVTTQEEPRPAPVDLYRAKIQLNERKMRK